MTQREFLLEFLKFHYKQNPFRKRETNEKDIEDFLAELPANTEVKNISSNPVLVDSASICKYEGCFLPATCKEYCGGHCECPA